MNIVEKVDKYLTEEDGKNEFYSWLNEKKEVTCTIVDGGMMLAMISRGNVKVKRGTIPEFSIWSGKAEINFRYAAANYKPRQGNGWLVEAKSKKLTYELY